MRILVGLIVFATIGLGACSDESGGDAQANAPPPGWFNEDGLVVGDRDDPDRLANIRRSLISPDGEELLVFGRTSDRGFGLGLAEDGFAQTIPLEGIDVLDAAWMPGSDRVLVASGNNFDNVLDPDWTELLIVSLDGEVVERIDLASRLLIDSTGMAVTADGQHVYAAAMPATARLVPRDLYRINLGTGAIDNLSESPSLSEDYPTIMPNGDIFVAQEGIITRADQLRKYPPRGDDRVETEPPLVASASTVHPTEDTLLFQAYPLDGSLPTGVWGYEGDNSPKHLGIPGQWPTAARGGAGIVVHHAGSPASGSWLRWVPFPHVPNRSI